MNKFTLAALAALGFPAALIAQSTTGSSGTGTTEPGPSAAEASGFGNTRRTPSVSGKPDVVPRGTGTISNQTSSAPTPAAGAATAYHGSAITADALFQKLDTNGDGQLTREEFAKFHAVMGTTGSGGTSTTGAEKGKQH